jgi:hypothetical protein
VKIDVEGTELDVLRGAAATLRRANPLVLFEHVGDASEATREIFGLLGSLRYRIFDIDGAGPLDAAAFGSSCRGGRIWNYLAAPS